ncbi:MAG: nitroreductase family protein [Clostridiales bacterium]|nr:nitroreductase family protein [Clostridiales bacterium]
MDFYEVINTRRSIRKYKATEIPQEVIKKVMIAAGIAPSGRNRQKWKYILVYDKKMQKQLVEFCRNQEFVGNCPVTVVVCGASIPQHNRGNYMGEFGMLMDTSITFTHFMLAARAEGLGTCWIGLYDNEKVKTLLDVPEDWDVVALSPLGYPEDENAFHSNIKRLDYDELVSIDQF